MAIVNGKSGTFNISTYNTAISGYVEWQETYDDSTYLSTNKSTVTIKAYLHRTNIYSGETYVVNAPMTRVAYFGKENVTDTSAVSLSIAGTTTSGGGAYTKVYEASKEITHDGNGTKSITLGFRMSNDVGGVAGNSFTVPETYSTVTLTTIPRYANITSFSVSKRDETSVTFGYTADATCDWAKYSLDNANWYDLPNNGVVGGLSANTTYTFYLALRRKDSQLWSYSSGVKQTTYDYPYCTESPNFTIGDELTLKFYNPLGRIITIYVIGDNGAEVGGATTGGTSISGYKYDGMIDWWYSTIPSKQSGKYQVKVVYGSSTKVRNNGNTYSIKGTEKPTVGSITYADTNSTITAITGNNQHIVQNQSNLKVTYTKATPNNGAGSISKYSFTLNGVTKESTSAGGTVDFGKVNSASNLTLTMTVTDSRGLTSSTTKTITMLAHSNPTAIVTLNRLNNYEDTTYLTVDGSISSVNSKNTMTIKYRYKVSGGSYGSYTTISDNVKQTLTLDKNNSYIFNVVITDAFGTTYNKEHVLGKGVFPLFIDTEKNSVGINGFPTKEKSFEVFGEIYIDGKTIQEHIEFIKHNSYTFVKDAGNGISCIKISNLEIGGIYEISVVYNFNTNGHMNYSSVIYGILSIPCGYNYYSLQVVVRPKFNVISNYYGIDTGEDYNVSVGCDSGSTEINVANFLSVPQVYIYMSRNDYMEIKKINIRKISV